MGRHYLPRTGHTDLGGMGRSATGVVGVSFRAHGEALWCVVLCSGVVCCDHLRCAMVCGVVMWFGMMSCGVV